MPAKEPVDRREEARKMRASRPQYTSYLPRVFPFRTRIDPVGIGAVTEWLARFNYSGYAITASKSDLRGYFTFWASSEVALALSEYGVIPDGLWEEVPL